MEILANELRVGNWVYAPNFIVYDVISTAEMNDLSYYRIIHIYENYGNNKLCEPIPLTPEILEKLGFKWETDKKTHLYLTLPIQGINNRRIDFYYNNGVCEMLQMYMEDYLDGYFQTLPPLYLHQLQNLYFSLVGEELIINL